MSGGTLVRIRTGPAGGGSSGGSSATSRLGRTAGCASGPGLPMAPIVVLYVFVVVVVVTVTGVWTQVGIGAGALLALVLAAAAVRAEANLHHRRQTRRAVHLAALHLQQLADAEVRRCLLALHTASQSVGQVRVHVDAADLPAPPRELTASRPDVVDLAEVLASPDEPFELVEPVKVVRGVRA